MRALEHGMPLDQTSPPEAILTQRLNLTTRLSMAGEAFYFLWFECQFHGSKYR